VEISSSAARSGIAIAIETAERERRYAFCGTAALAAITPDSVNPRRERHSAEIPNDHVFILLDSECDGRVPARRGQSGERPLAAYSQRPVEVGAEPVVVVEGSSVKVPVAGFDGNPDSC